MREGWREGVKYVAGANRSQPKPDRKPERSEGEEGRRVAEVCGKSLAPKPDRKPERSEGEVGQGAKACATDLQPDRKPERSEGGSHY